VRTKCRQCALLRSQLLAEKEKRRAAEVDAGLEGLLARKYERVLKEMAALIRGALTARHLDCWACGEPADGKTTADGRQWCVECFEKLHEKRGE